MPNSRSSKAAGNCVYYCEICQAAMWNKFSLRRHVLTHKHFIDNVIPVPDFLKVALPPDEQFSVLNLKKYNAEAFTVKIILPNVKNAKTYREWLQCFMKINNCIYVCVGISNFRNRKRKKSTSLAASLHQMLHKCQHFSSEIGKKRKRKGTLCKSKIYATIKKSGELRYTLVTIHFNHNHSNESAEALRYRKPDAEIKSIFKLMFDEGILSPSIALYNYKNHLRIQLDETQYLLQCANRSVIPDYDWVRHLFILFSQDLYGCSKPASFIQLFKDVIKEHSTTLKDICALKELPNNDVVVAILSPMMKRTLQEQVSSKILFMDSIGSVRLFEIKIFFMITRDEIPGGIVIVSKESARVLKEGFNLFFTLIDDNCFGGRKKGPVVLMTEDFGKKLPVLSSLFPESRIMFSTFHFLQSFFKFLINTENNICDKDRLLVYAKIRNAIFANNRESFDISFEEACNATSDEKLQMYLEKVYSKRRRWAHCYLPDDVHRDITANFMGRSMRIFKDHLLDTLKTRSAVELMNFLTKGYEECFNSIQYCAEIDHPYVVEFALNDNEGDFYELVEHKECDKIYYLVNRSKNIKYLINTDVGICTCYKGAESKFCKHQFMLQKIKRIKQSSVSLKKDEIKCVINHAVLNDTKQDSLSVNDHEAVTSLCKTECVAPTSEHPNDENNLLISHAEVIIESTDNFISGNETEINEYTKKLKENFVNWIDKMKERPDFFVKGITSMNEELLKVIASSPAAQLSALLNFNKNIDGLQ